MFVCFRNIHKIFFYCVLWDKSTWKGEKVLVLSLEYMHSKRYFFLCVFKKEKTKNLQKFRKLLDQNAHMRCVQITFDFIEHFEFLAISSTHSQLLRCLVPIIYSPKFDYGGLLQAAVWAAITLSPSGVYKRRVTTTEPKSSVYAWGDWGISEG